MITVKPDKIEKSKPLTKQELNRVRIFWGGLDLTDRIAKLQVYVRTLGVDWISWQDHEGMTAVELGRLKFDDLPEVLRQPFAKFLAKRYLPK